MDAFKTGVALCENSAVTVGSFDGLHKGHQRLLSEVLSHDGLSKGVVTFSRPTRAKKSKNYAGDILTLRLKLKKLELWGFDFVVLIDFSSEFAKTSGGEFFDILVKTICMKSLVVGKDFSCGFQHSTDVVAIEKIAKNYGFCFTAIDRVFLDGQNISSSNIRLAIQNGDFDKARKFLGYSFLLDISDVGVEAFSELRFCISVSAFCQIIPRDAKVKICLKDGKKLKGFFSVFGDKVVLELDCFPKNNKLESDKIIELFDYLIFD